MRHRGAAFGLGEHDGVGLAGHHRVEVGVGHAGVEAVDAHQKPRAVLLALHGFQKIQRRLARDVLALGRNRILEVEDHRVGAAGEGLVELGPAVGGNEEKGAHQVTQRPGRLS